MNFAQGQKHPDTHPTIFKNVWEWDRIRKLLKNRCDICDVVVSSDSKVYKELIYKCRDKSHECHKSVYSPGSAHQVCENCYDLWHALYGNKGLKNYNYYKELDDKDRAEAKRLKDNLEGKL